MTILDKSTTTKYPCLVFALFLIIPSMIVAQTNNSVRANSTSGVACPSDCKCFTSVPQNVTVVWGYNGHLCSSSSDCYNENDPRGIQGKTLPRQKPVVIHLDDRLFFQATSKMAVPIKPFNVSESSFDTCTFDGAEITSSFTPSLFEVSNKFINTTGIKYFITDSSNMVYRCEFGLKLEVYVRSRQPCINPLAPGSDVCSNKGLCSNCPNTFFTFNTSCICETGYIGSYCEELNSCHSTLNPCRNGATCIDRQSGLADDYVCNCITGYSGRHCETNINDCVPEPCQNGGLCLDEVNNYRCLCQPGYHGRNCSELKPNPCNPNPCVNGGTCDLAGSSRLNYTCTCPQSFGGKNCSDNVTLSSSVDITVSTTMVTPPMTVLPTSSLSTEVQTVLATVTSQLVTSTITTSSPIGSVVVSSSMTSSRTGPTPSSVILETSSTKVIMSTSMILPSSSSLVIPSSSVVATVTPTVPPTTVPLKDQTCKDNPCNRGTCLNVPDSLGFNFTCQCPKPTFGPRCSTDFKLHFPRFGNNSYLVHKPIAFAPGFNKIVITFKTTQENGLLFYSTHKKYRDFIQLYIINGELEYRFDPGDSLVAIRSDIKVNTGEIVIAVVTYDSKNKEGSLQVNNGTAQKVKARGRYVGIGLYNEWYIGGMPPGKTFGSNDEAKSTPTFHGCIRDIELNGDQIAFTEATDWNNINECDQPCDHKPCHNNGQCVGDINDPHDYQCKCPVGFEGKNCKTSRVCSGDPCKGGLCLANATNSGKICLCPYGRSGMSCEKDINITVPTFSMVNNYASYIQYQVPVLSGQHFTITLQFKIDNSSGACASSLLMFSGQDQYQGKGDDFIALGISGNTVVFQYNLGSGIARISSDPLDNNLEWHSITAGRSGKEGYLYVDNQVSKRGSSPGELVGLNLYSPLYIGGVPDVTELPSNVEFKCGFQGYITNVAVRFSSTKPFISLLTSQTSVSNSWPVVSGRNIGDKSYNGCNGSYPCQNNGTCVAKGASVSCSCVNGWKGMFCSSKDIPCINHNPCVAVKATCREVNNKAVCDCPLGKTGQTCSQSISIQQPRFNENSYMAFSPSNVSGQDIYIRANTNIKIIFTPTNQNGLLFYVAHKISSQRGDFLSISFHNGYVHYRYDLGSGVAKLQSQNTVALNTEHTVEITRTSKTGTLTVDSQSKISGTSPLDAVALDVTSFFYLGGVPQLSSVNPSAVFDSSSLKDFVGCVKSVKVNGISLSLTENGAKEGRNIDSCPSPILS